MPYSVGHADFDLGDVRYDVVNSSCFHSAKLTGLNHCIGILNGHDSYITMFFF